MINIFFFHNEGHKTCLAFLVWENSASDPKVTVLPHTQWSRKYQNQDFLGMSLPRVVRPHYTTKMLVINASFRMISDQEVELWMKNRILWQVTSQGDLIINS